MKKSTLSISLIVAGLAFCALLTTRPASAQLPVIGGPAAISVGDFLPSDYAPRHNGGASQFSIEARYALPGIPLTGLRTIGEVGLEDGNRDGNHSTIVPLTIGEYLGGNGKSPLSMKNVYGGVGAGVYFVNENGLSSAARIGGYAALGYNTPIALFVEAKYQVAEHADGTTLSVGLRF